MPNKRPPSPPNSVSRPTVGLRLRQDENASPSSSLPDVSALSLCSKNGVSSPGGPRERLPSVAIVEEEMLNRSKEPTDRLIRQCRSVLHGHEELTNLDLALTL